MADQNNAPERIWIRITDKTVMYAKPSDADDLDVEYIRADRAAPDGHVRGYTEIADIIDRNITDETVNGRHRLRLEGEWHEGPVVDWVHKTLTGIRDLLRKYATLTPPPAAQTYNTALVADRPIDTSRKEIETCLFRGSPGWHNRLIRAVADERDVARAEIERLKRELEITHNSRNELAETWKARAIKAEAERDEARAERDAMMADPLYIIGVNHGWDEAVENDAAHPAARPMQSMLAGAERDMRQRAADAALLCGAEPAPLNDGCGTVILKAVYGPDIAKAILALSLKHADREGGV